MNKGKRKYDGSGKGRKLNKGRGGCVKPKSPNTRRVVKRRRDGVVQAYHEVPKNIQKQIIEANLEEAIKQLKKEGRVRLPRLGILKIKVQKAKPAKMGRNPFSGEQMMFKAKPKKKVIKFSASKDLKELMN